MIPADTEHKRALLRDWGWLSARAEEHPHLLGGASIALAAAEAIPCAFWAMQFRTPFLRETFGNAVLVYLALAVSMAFVVRRGWGGVLLGIYGMTLAMSLLIESGPPPGTWIALSSLAAFGVSLSCLLAFVIHVVRALRGAA